MRLDATTVLIWTLRILLPILFFAIYFKLKEPKKTPGVVNKSGSDRNVYSRANLLRLRKTADGMEVPDSMRNITFKDQSQAPELFSGSGRSARTERSTRRAGDESRAPKEKKDKKEKKDDIPQAVAYSEGRMHLESLVNYVAFQGQEQQRCFLPSHDSQVPLSRKERMEEKIDAKADIANDEAQMVLRGSIKLQRSDIAKTLYDQLVQSQVAVSRQTFELLLEACVIAKDLTGASDFMMKMEQQGLTPPTDLMDRVMDLYTERKSQEGPEEEPQAQALNEPSSMVDEPENLSPSRVALPDNLPLEHIVQEPLTSTMSLPLDVPYAMQGPLTMPMFNWDAIASSDDDDDDGDTAKTRGLATQLSSDAPVFVPSFISEPTAAETSYVDAAAVNYAWESAGTTESHYIARYDSLSWAGEGSKGKGKQKGNTKGKGQGEREHRKGKSKGRNEWPDEFYEGAWQSGTTTWRDRSEWARREIQ